MENPPSALPMVPDQTPSGAPGLALVVASGPTRVATAGPAVYLWLVSSLVPLLTHLLRNFGATQLSNGWTRTGIRMRASDDGGEEIIDEPPAGSSPPIAAHVSGAVLMEPPQSTPAPAPRLSCEFQMVATSPSCTWKSATLHDQALVLYHGIVQIHRWEVSAYAVCFHNNTSVGTYFHYNLLIVSFVVHCSSFCTQHIRRKHSNVILHLSYRHRSTCESQRQVPSLLLQLITNRGMYKPVSG